MKRVFVLLSLLAFMGLGLSGAAEQPASQVGHSAPDFTLKDLLSGRPVTLSSLRGQPALLVLWSLGCGTPCFQQLAALQEFYQNYQDLLQVLTVAPDPEPELRAFLDERFPQLGFTDKFGASIDRLTFPILLDDGQVLRAYRPARLPALYFLDLEGVIREISLPLGRALRDYEIVELFAAKVFEVQVPFLPLGPGLLKSLTVRGRLGGQTGALVEQAEVFDLDGDDRPEGVALSVNLPQGPRSFQLAFWRGELRGALPEEITLQGRVVGVIPPAPVPGPELLFFAPLDRRIVYAVQLQLNDEDRIPELIIADEDLDGLVDILRVDPNSDGQVELDLRFPLAGPGAGYPIYTPTFRIELGEYFFRVAGGEENAPIRLKAGEEYLIEFVNVGNTIHEGHFGKGADLVRAATQEGPGEIVGLVLLPGTSALVHVFIPERLKGEVWEVHCFVPGHHEVGMEAEVIFE